MLYYILWAILSIIVFVLLGIAAFTATLLTIDFFAKDEEEKRATINFLTKEE